MWVTEMVQLCNRVIKVSKKKKLCIRRHTQNYAPEDCAKTAIPLTASRRGTDNQTCDYGRTYTAAYGRNCSLHAAVYGYVLLQVILLERIFSKT